ASQVYTITTVPIMHVSTLPCTGPRHSRRHPNILYRWRALYWWLAVSPGPPSRLESSHARRTGLIHQAPSTPRARISLGVGAKPRHAWLTYPGSDTDR